MTKENDISIFYGIKDKEPEKFKEIQKIIIEAIVSYEHYKRIKEYDKSDDLRKLLNDFNIRVENQKDGRIFYYSPELLWTSLIKVMNMP